MPAVHSEEWNVEEVLIRRYGIDPFLSGYEGRHYDMQSAALTEVIIVQGVRDEKILEGSAGYLMKAKVIFASSVLPEEVLEFLKGRLSTVPYEPMADYAPILTPDLADFFIEGGASANRENLPKLRKVTVEIPITIKLID